MQRAGSGADQPGWTVRTIPNKFPTVTRDAAAVPGSAGSGMFEGRAGSGIHEVIIQSPRHSPTLPFLSPAHQRSIFGMFRERFRALSAEPGIQSVVLFENVGPESGGTLFHPHSQAVALPLVPPALAEEVAGGKRWTRSHDGACVWESMGSAERNLRTRLVWEDDTLLAFAPWASHYPYELLVMPLHHSPSFSEASELDLDRLADVMPRLLGAILKVEPRASYNYFLHSAPVPGDPVDFHWHWHLAPRLIRPDGFELGSGLSVNPVAPESAAEQVRSALNP